MSKEGVERRLTTILAADVGGDATQGRKRIFEEQTRIRNNLGRIPSNSDLYRRYLKKLNKQEDALERLDRDTAGAKAAVNAAQDTLVDYIAGLEM